MQTIVYVYIQKLAEKDKCFSASNITNNFLSSRFLAQAQKLLVIVPESCELPEAVLRPKTDCEPV